ncbi:MAG: 50S ribosomal protein L25 [Candidatus Pacebacteria bacterium]|jgi:large subunit ribosomal protein L25|nr:50S ribosomal protein L25 [Candidatus Paceibacterota bacterium]MDD2796790.1 50S ribosomal protein L25 [Candidatus Paceibacterota bacterium]MDD3047924.1 50S ribosomal protein L25 [Candidatus Paceibacterota bacterium]MDD3510015.1 50S ribosomal protein L25 [Candidatus Paceibacterota bacterium]MDD3918502.1 50S ribosomal protein L25 [Candidatus Paceibacterota bacterium]
MYSLKAETREKREKQEGFISAILYGSHIKKNILLKVEKDDFKKIFKEAGQTSLIELENNKKKYTVLVYDFQEDPITGEFIHIDFYSPDLKEEVETEVPIELKGKAGAVELGGTLIQSLRVLNVSALPADLPHKIEIDVSSLKTFEDYIDVASVDLGKKVKILTNKEEVIATVVESEAEEIEEEKQEDKTITTNEA